MSHDFIRYGQKIGPVETGEKMQDNLKKYCELAKSMGATDAKIISSSEVLVDQRVRFKCQYPLCKFYGGSANCPPHTAGVEEMREFVKLFSYGILMIFKCSSDRIVTDAQTKNADDKRDLYKVLSAVESAAFYDGYYFAVGFGSGPCKNVFCADHQSCSALEGHGCRAATFARASMEAVGMDVFGMVTKQGWDIYPIGRSCKAPEVPEGTRVGLVLVG